MECTLAHVASLVIAIHERFGKQGAHAWNQLFQTNITLSGWNQLYMAAKHYKKGKN